MRRGDHRQDPTNDSRAGIALVMVLGILAILVIMIVGFSITSRTERLSSQAFFDSARGRQFLHAAIARTMQDLDDNLAGTPPLFYPDWPNGLLASSGSGGPMTWDLSDYALSFVTPSEEGAVRAASPSWQLVDLGFGITGRYAFVAVNHSGMLDASVVSGESRDMGRNPSEIRISDLVSDYVTFLEKRSNEWIRFESYPEINVLAFGQGLAVDTEELFPFSRFTPDGHWDGSALNSRFDIGGDENALLASEQEITQKFEDAGLSDPGGAFINLLDFVDADNIPRDLNSFCTEQVPMINEVTAGGNYQVEPDPGNPNGAIATLSITLRVEGWYPFNQSEGHGTYSLNAVPGIRFETIVPGNYTAPIDGLILGESPVPDTANNSVNISGYTYAKFEYEYQGTPQPIPLEPALNRIIVDVTVTDLQMFVGGSGSGTAVDQVGPLPTIRLRLRSNQETEEVGVSVVDPRLNHLPAQWNTETVTMEGMNNNARGGDYGAGSLVPPNPVFYVRNRPLGENPRGSVADLGFLSIGNPWETIRLYNTPAGDLHPILDYFTLIAPGARLGLVNPNSGRRNVLAAVYSGTLIEPIPGAGGSRLDWAQSQLMADRLLAVTAVQFMTNISEVGKFTRNDAVGFLGQGATVSDGEIESSIRNSYELFGFRQNLFTTFIAAQLLSEDGIPVSDMRSVAVIWRDPLPNANGHHASFVRFLHHLAR